MSSPSPSDPSKMEHHYQSSDASDHGLLSHTHVSCTCCRECAEQKIDHPSNTESTLQLAHLSHHHCQVVKPPSSHHHIITLSHPAVTSHVHPVMNTVSHHDMPLSSPIPKSITNVSQVGKISRCTCHLQSGNETDVSEATSQVRKLDEDRIEVSPLPPALPPRPPPRPRWNDGTGSLSSRCRPPPGGSKMHGYPVMQVVQYHIPPALPPPHFGPHISSHSAANPGGIKKYVFWCCACGGLATILGAMFMAVYFLLRTYTSTLAYFETIPTFVPATMLILTGLCVISLARRKNRYSYLIKVCGLCCLVCALTCVLVTITTTVIHMNRLQTLRECVYTQKTRTCTCYSVLLEAQSNMDDGMRYVFDATPDCEVIHGALYTCLRAMFGLSVSGILVCIFSCMLVYQLLSHEKKKMYWEQLELRCRSFYNQSSVPPSAHGSVRGPPVPSSTYCSCCEECRYPPVPTGPQVYPWDPHHVNERFWTGRVGNLYSPNPEECPPVNPDTRSRPGWSWRRLPWSRGNAGSDTQRDNSLTYQAPIGSADSQYGFSNHRDHPMASDQISASTGSYSMLDNRPQLGGGMYVWGPPPPYSDPNSPARRYGGVQHHQSPARYHHIHHHPHSHESHCQMVEHVRTSRRTRPPPNNKDNYENTGDADVHTQTNEHNDSTDTSSCLDRSISHTLPVRKVKKRTNDMASVKSTSQTPNHRTNVQNIFSQSSQEVNKQNETENDYHEPHLPESRNKVSSSEGQQCRFLPRLQGVENAAFQKQESTSPEKPSENTESEVYFADVSSCCNISVRNDSQDYGQDSSLYDEALENQKPRLLSLQKPTTEQNKDGNTAQIIQNFTENIANATMNEDEGFLAHKLNARQMSTRSRMPFPLPSPEELSEFTTDPCIQLLSKDISQNSLCSNVQTPMTESTEATISPDECCSSSWNEPGSIHTRCFTPSTTEHHFLAPDAQYEVMPEQETFKSASNLTNIINGVNYDQNYYNQNRNYNRESPKGIPPKTLNLGQQNRRNIGSNISALIQNLGGNPAGLLYGEANLEDEVQGQGCHSDGTMDSGWQSGSEKNEHRAGQENNCSENVTSHKPVNV